MLNLVTETNADEEAAPNVEVVGAAEDEDLETTRGKQALQKGRLRYYGKQQQLKLVLAAQELSRLSHHEVNLTELGKEEDCGVGTECTDIWDDTTCLVLLKEGMLLDTCDLEEGKRARRRVSNYFWREQRFYFKGLYVPKPKERIPLVVQMHQDLGHSGEHRMSAEIFRRYFWHSRTKDVRSVIKTCQQCQLVGSEGNIRSRDEQLKSIPICDLFHRVALDTTGPLPETKSRNKYILVAIDHYSKWCEAKAVVNHGAKTTAGFLEDDIIYRYGVPKFVLTDNGGEWATEFDLMCKDYGIQHQCTAPQWPQCNGMAERIIKTIEHDITVLATTPKSVDCWDEQLAKILFGYRCGIQASTKFSPFMILTGRTPRLRADNYLDILTTVTNDSDDVEIAAAHFVQKMELIASIHEDVLLNVEQAQKKQRKAYAARKGKHLFEGLIAGETMVRMKKPGKK